MSTKKEQEPKFNVSQWMAEHRVFVAWWKEHRDSGYSENGEGQFGWSIKPWHAYRSERYLAEYTGKVGKKIKLYTPEEIAAMQTEQREAEEMTGELEARFGPMFWETMTPQQFIASTKTVVRERCGKLDEVMKSKIEEAYSPEHGQPEKETELLGRRR